MSYATLLDAWFALDLTDSELRAPDIEETQEETRGTGGKEEKSIRIPGAHHPGRRTRIA
jgi:hypothetical protein